MMTVIRLVGLALLVAGCSNLTSVAAPDVVQPSALDNPGGALVRRAGAVSDFATGVSYQALTSGILTDELFDKSGIVYPFDRRVVGPVGNPGPYGDLSKARIDALRALRSLEQYNPTPAWHIGEMFAYLGFAETIFAEDLCSGVPLSDVVGGAPIYGVPLTRGQLLQRALADFDSAAAHTGGTDSIARLALIGRARALVDSGDFAAAASTVSGIPVGYAYVLPYSATISAQQNFVDLADVSTEESVSDREGINGLDFRSAGDPRVVTQQYGVSTDGTTPLYNATKYNTPAAPLVLANGVEGQLIAAESVLQSDTTGATWIAAINALRADSAETGVAGLGPLPNPTTYHDRVDLMFRERAFWLFGTGHREGDLRRLIRQYGRPTESVFPTGLYEGGPATYGTDIMFVPDRNEGANPNFHGCIDRAA